MNWLLRRASRQVREQFVKDGIHADEELRVYRKFVIEECARVADGFGYNMDIAKMLAAAIRALKDKS